MSTIQSLDSKASFVICDDINAHHNNWLTSHITGCHGHSAYESSFSSGCDQLIQEPTQISGNPLDLVSDLPSMGSTSVGVYMDTSDHCLLSIKTDVDHS